MLGGDQPPPPSVSPPIVFPRSLVVSHDDQCLLALEFAKWRFFRFRGTRNRVNERAFFAILLVFRADQSQVVPHLSPSPPPPPTCPAR